MPINLKHINTLDSDQIKLDIVNYNFDQLAANGGGPRGPQGSIGQAGPQGITGPQGFSGPIGISGDQGPDPIINVNYWSKIDAEAGAINAITLVPLHNPGDQFAPVINIGYLDTDTDYKSKQELVEGKTPYQWVISRKPYMSSNLRFKNRQISDNGYDFKLEKVDDLDQLTMGFSKYTVFADNISDITAYKTIFKNTSGVDNSFNISTELAEFNLKTEFNLPVDIKRNLIIQNADADIDSVATSENNNGLVKFKRTNELRGTVPFGTIISMSSIIFSNSSYFVNSETVTGVDNAPIEITVGRGLGLYRGWYLCNGKEWINGTGISYQVPMLGKFNYSIQDNPFSNLPDGQGAAITNNTSKYIISGSDISTVSAFTSNVETGSRTYSVTSTIDMGNSLINIDCGLNLDNGTLFSIKQFPQIIYLDRDDLYWADKGTGQDPPVLLEFLLDDGNITPSKLSPDPYSLGIINDQPAFSSYSKSLTVTSPAGYYWSTLPGIGDITGFPGYATLSSITSNGDPKPTTINILIDIDSHPEDPQNILLNINTTTFFTASFASISLVRTNPENVTCVTPTTVPILYNFDTGYSFQLEYIASEGHEFNSSPISGITQPAAGGGTINVISSSLSNQNKTLVINIKLDGIPIIGYLPTITYYINATPNIGWVQIGTQKWTNKNLNVTKYRSGITIPEWTGDDAGWNALITGAWCYPGGNSANGPTYGKLYNWYAVAGIIQQNTNVANQDIAPEGYYVPSRSEWISLVSASQSISPLGNSGGKLKATGTIENGDGLWKEPNSGANNVTGFTALPAGFRDLTTVSMQTGVTANWWSIDKYNHQLSFNLATMSNALGGQKNGYAVRLLKDSKPVQTIGLSCNTTVSGPGLKEWKIQLDPLGGILLFEFNPSSVPDKMEILHNEVRKATTSMLANSNSGPFDTYYGNYIKNIPTSTYYIDQFIGDSSAYKNIQPIPTRQAELLAGTGISRSISAGSQYVWWKYTADDYIINNYAVARGVGGREGSTWNFKRICV